MSKILRTLLAAGVLAVTMGALTLSHAGAGTADTKAYMVVFKDDYAVNGSSAVGDVYAVEATYAVAEQYAVSIIEQAGGTITSNLVKEIGVAVVTSSNTLFDEVMRSSAVVAEAGENYVWKGVTTEAEALASGAGPFSHPGDGGGGPKQTVDPLEGDQWNMMNINAPQAHNEQAGWRAVDVGILDTGIDGNHHDFDDDGLGPLLTKNVDCSRGRDSIGATNTTIISPGVGFPDPCVDNGFHGTHVAGIVAAQANGFGVVGVAPEVMLVPVKVCDSTGFCYANAVVDGITYAGHQKFDVINMSFFVDDNEFQQSHEFKCSSDPVQRTFRHAVERAVGFARNRGVVPVAALGNSDQDLAHPVGLDSSGQPLTNECEVVPAETQGVIGTMALGRSNEKASYSNYGTGATDVAAPGGTATATNNGVLSTFPADQHFRISGTSMASPHSAGVSALIVSEYGKLTTDTNDTNTTLDDTAPPLDVELRPQTVEAYLQGTAVDLTNALGPTATKTLIGYDECFGHGRIDAVRAVNHQTSVARQVVPTCLDGQD